jgi:hypothetical protein
MYSFIMLVQMFTFVAASIQALFFVSLLPETQNLIETTTYWPDREMLRIILHPLADASVDFPVLVHTIVTCDDYVA